MICTVRQLNDVGILVHRKWRFATTVPQRLRRVASRSLLDQDAIWPAPRWTIWDRLSHLAGTAVVPPLAVSRLPEWPRHPLTLNQKKLQNWRAAPPPRLSTRS